MMKMSLPARSRASARPSDSGLTVGQPVDGEQRHVPIGMDHHDLAHDRARGRRPAVLALEVEAGGRARLERQAPVAQPLGESSATWRLVISEAWPTTKPVPP